MLAETAEREAKSQYQHFSAACRCYEQEIHPTANLSSSVIQQPFQKYIDDDAMLIFCIESA